MRSTIRSAERLNKLLLHSLRSPQFVFETVQMGGCQFKIRGTGAAAFRVKHNNFNASTLQQTPKARRGRLG